MIGRIYLFLKKILWHIISFIIFSFFTIFKKKSQTIIVFPYAIGDTCYALSYRAYFLKKSKCKFYFSEGCKIMIETCYSDIINNADVSYYRRKRYIYKFIRIINNSPLQYSFFKKFGIIIPYPFAYFKLNELLKYDYFTFLRKKVFTYIPEKANIEFPKVPKCEINCIDDFHKNKDKIVILNPFSYSMSFNEKCLWENIVNILISNGFIVYCNVNKNQIEINRTKRLECSIIELYNICNEIPLFISIRSGIIDFTISSSCKKIVIWNMDTYLSKNLRNFYDVDAWGINNAFSIYHKNNSDTLEEFSNLFSVILGFNN